TQIEGVADLVDGSAFDGYRSVGVTGGTSTPIEDLAVVARRVLEVAGAPSVRGREAELAAEALAAAATPAGRTTSLPRHAGQAEAAAAR
ncbi:MAG: hypothetical protein MUE82_05035, partial [Chloroflexi bacterium]|nr:hypothetical protein [Chloroflexota bacterium]